MNLFFPTSGKMIPGELAEPFLFDAAIGADDARGAELDGPYRYRLWRRWNDSLGIVCFVMLNPSTADAQRDDPTVRRCVAFARRWGHGGIVVANLFAFRATNPRELRPLGLGVARGPRNYLALAKAARESYIVVAAWGDLGGALFPGHAAQVARSLCLAKAGALYCLGTTVAGNPRHPLYLAADTPLLRYRPAGFVPIGEGA